MLAFIALYLFTLPALLIILSLGVLFSMGDLDGWAVFAGIVSGVIAFFLFGLSILQIGIFTAIYFVAGIAWSFWRYKRYAENEIELFNSRDHHHHVLDRDCLVERLKIENMAGRITGWILSWPFSMIENVVGDVIRLIRNMVTDTLKGVYNSILNSATQKINPLKETE